MPLIEQERKGTEYTIKKQARECQERHRMGSWKSKFQVMEYKKKVTLSRTFAREYLLGLEKNGSTFFSIAEWEIL